MNAFNTLPKGHIIKDRYKVQSIMGSGHSSVVYKTVDMRTGAGAALKIMDPLLSQDPVNLERFRREVEILAPLNHPSIITIYDIFQTEDFHCISMELAEGLDGKALLKKKGQMEFPNFLRIARQVLDALACCHDKGIMHRDIKPQNIIIDSDWKIKLLDFGIAKMNTMSDLTKTGASLGTPEYMAPELFLKGHSCDPRVDVYGVGLVLHEFLTGRPLFRAQSLNALFQLHKTGERESVSSIRWDIPDWIDSILLKCLETDPGARYQSIDEIQSDLKKKEMAAAHLQKEAEPSLCKNCQIPAIVHMPFCHKCGTFSSVAMTPGDFSVVVQDCGEKDRLAEFMEKNYQGASVNEIKKKLEKPPALIADKISKDAAQRIAVDLSLFPCKVSITANLSKTFRLPDYYAAIGLALPLILIMFSGFRTGSLLFLGIGVVVCEALAYMLFRAKTVPLINIKLQNTEKPADSISIAYAKMMQKVVAPKFRTAFAHVLSRYFRLREKMADMPGVEAEMESLGRVVGAAFKSLGAAEGFLGSLESTSLVELKERELRLSVQIDTAKDATQIDKLIKMKTECISHIKMYREMEDRYQRLFTSVIQTNGALQRYEDSLRDLSTEGMLSTVLEKMNSTYVMNGDFDPFT